MDYINVKESVVTMVSHIRDPFSFLNIDVADSDNLIEVDISSSKDNVVYLSIAVTETNFRILKRYSIQEEAVTVSYDSYMQLFSILIDALYSLYIHFNNKYSVVELVSTMLNTKIRNWKDFVRFIFNRSGEDYVEGSDYFRYNGFVIYVRDMSVYLEGVFSSSKTFDNNLEVIQGLISVLEVLFNYSDIEVNPMLESKYVEVTENEGAEDEESENGEMVEGPSGDDIEGSAPAEDYVTPEDVENSEEEENNTEEAENAE